MRALLAATRRDAVSASIFLGLALLIVLLGLVRSFWSTARDSFTIDEAWHVVAGVSYQRYGDFRLNPEHPPLVKRWVGAWLSADDMSLRPLPVLHDKQAERGFIGEVVYEDNDSDRVQARVRLAMLTFHGAFLLALAWALRRALGAGVALTTLAVLLIDPTVAAHLPLAMTDLPIALLATLSVVLACSAFQSWQLLELGALGLALGLTLAAKHSGLLCALLIAALGLSAIVRRGSLSRWQRGARVAGVLVAAHLILCASYYASGSGARAPTASAAPASTDEVAFNRPLPDKIEDIESSVYRTLLTAVARTRLWPEPYVWGMADVVRAGVEGRHASLYVFGRLFDTGTPWFFFPSVLLVKLPLGASVLALLGLGLLLTGKHEPEPRRSGLVLSLWGAVFLACLMAGNSGYAGMRHALPVVPIVALLAALPIVQASRALLAREPGDRRGPWRASPVLLGCVALAASALPVVRPWEYYNELVGGSSGAWRYFSDEGMDLGQRSRELASYYDTHLRDRGERAYDYYGVCEEERVGRQLAFASAEDSALDTDLLSGTVFLNATELVPDPLYDYAAFRAGAPIERFGNLLVYRGEYRLPWLRAYRRLELARDALSSEPRDLQRAATLLEEAARIVPSHYEVTFELGNVLLELGQRRAALAAFELTVASAPPDHSVQRVLLQHLEVLQRDDGSPLQPARSPWME